MGPRQKCCKTVQRQATRNTTRCNKWLRACVHWVQQGANAAACMGALGSTGCECKNKGEPLLLLLLLPNYDDHLATATLLLPLLRCRSIVMLMPTALYCHCQCYSAALLQAIAMRTLLFLCILRCTEIHILCAIPQPFLLKACPAN